MYASIPAVAAAAAAAVHVQHSVQPADARVIAYAVMAAALQLVAVCSKPPWQMVCHLDES